LARLVRFRAVGARDGAGAAHVDVGAGEALTSEAASVHAVASAADRVQTLVVAARVVVDLALGARLAADSARVVAVALKTVDVLRDVVEATATTGGACCVAALLRRATTFRHARVSIKNLLAVKVRVARDALAAVVAAEDVARAGLADAARIAAAFAIRRAAERWLRHDVAVCVCLSIR